jgi:ectoine hydroxylase-related dioxygenase (phytanoyl-CoA dioxygenase family)
MTIQESLDELGATQDKLTVAEKNALDSEGWLLLKGILSPSQVEALRLRQSDLLALEGDDAGKEVHQESGADRLSDLINKGKVYHIVITHPRVLAAIAHVLSGEPKLSSLNSRDAQPGAGLQGLHADYGCAVEPGMYRVCNSLWLLDDFLPDNGATRVVPGSHLCGRLPQDDMTDTKEDHPRQILLQGKAGDVAVMNSHLWHGGTRNVSGKSRRVLHGYFTRQSDPQQLDQKRYLLAQTREQLSEAQRVLLGVD